MKDDLPIFGDGDTDLDRHLESFQDVCLVVKPSSDREKLRLFARTLQGTRRRCYDTIVKEAKSNGDYEARPNVVYDRVVAALDASFHESDEAKAMKARAKYDSLTTSKPRLVAKEAMPGTDCNKAPKPMHAEPHPSGGFGRFAEAPLVAEEAEAKPSNAKCAHAHRELLQTRKFVPIIGA